MRKAMSKKVGAGGRFDIFLDSAFVEIPVISRMLWKINAMVLKLYYYLIWASSTIFQMLNCVHMVSISNLMTCMT